MNRNRYTTLRDFANFANAVNRLATPYDYARNGGSTANGNGHNGHGQPVEFKAGLPLDVWADENAFYLQAYLPGVNPDEVEITFEGEELTIRGRFPAPNGEVKFVKRELFHGPFERRLTINTPVNAEGIQAEYSNGVLTLTVPKAEEVKPKQIKVVAK
jgi:HSP20 family protein